MSLQLNGPNKEIQSPEFGGPAGLTVAGRQVFLTSPPGFHSPTMTAGRPAVLLSKHPGQASRVFLYLLLKSYNTVPLLPCSTVLYFSIGSVGFSVLFARFAAKFV